MKWQRDTVTISPEARRRFQQMCDDEIISRKSKPENVEIINVEIKQKDISYMIYFITGAIAATSLGTLGYLLGKIFF